ncbi:MAG TPA: NAD(P)H-hydrate dehydratase [Gemmatimonadaceae bacterium]|nr:NAD(P)H-hydrate dehydratase [Gemmatimonadaceae bacterium]
MNETSSPAGGITPVPVLSAAQSATADAAAIAAGTPSLELMERAGAAATSIILARYRRLLAGGVRILAGPGNNGGDGWVVARLLAQQGVAVAVESIGDPRTAEAQAMRDRAAGCITSDRLDGAPVIVDALLGTGSRGQPRGAIANAVQTLDSARRAGARIVALDVPTGLDATTGEASLVAPAECTITFGSVKRGHLLARHLTGDLVVVDIGLGEPVGTGVLAELVTAEWVRSAVPAISPNAHKGTRGKLAIVGGAEGMAGACILAARSALRSGIGMVRVLVQPASLQAVQAAVPAALAGAWPDSDDEASELMMWADGLLIGPGLGTNSGARKVVERMLAAGQCPVALDADALNVFAGEAGALGSWLGGRVALLTPHPAEAGRLAEASTAEVLARRFEIAGELAEKTRAGVLLKGVPTVIAGVDGRTMVSARGTAALATGGSGDVLAGIAATLLLQMRDALPAGACAAFVHGRAAELADSSGTVRGVDLDDVITSLGAAWREWPPAPTPPVLAELVALGVWL